MAEWTEKMAAQNWCDQFKRNNGRLERADSAYMDEGSVSFWWDETPEGRAVWQTRFHCFQGGSATNILLCR